jgi:hypothetical protein
MSLDKSIKYGQERRKPYRGVKAYCKMCRNYSSCDYCRDNRLHNNKKRFARLNDLSKDLYITDE